MRLTRRGQRQRPFPRAVTRLYNTTGDKRRRIALRHVHRPVLLEMKAQCVGWIFAKPQGNAIATTIAYGDSNEAPPPKKAMTISGMGLCSLQCQPSPSEFNLPSYLFALYFLGITFREQCSLQYSIPADQNKCTTKSMETHPMPTKTG